MKPEQTDPQAVGQVQEQKSLSESISETFDQMSKAIADEERGEKIEEHGERESGHDEQHASREDKHVEEQRSEPVTAEGAEQEVEYDEPPPERWPEEMKKTYRELPSAAKKMMMENVFKPMQKTYTQTTMELAQQRKALGPIAETYEQYKEEFQRTGVDPAVALRQQLAWAAHFARVGPEQGIADMRKSLGLDKESGQPEPEGYLTPLERQLKQQVESIQGTLSQQQQAQQLAQQQQQQQAIQQRIQSAKQELYSFMSETNDGKPVYPHVEKVAQTMTGLIRGGVVKQVNDYGEPVPYKTQLKQAYEMAVEMNPQLRSASRSSGQVQRAVAAQKVGIVTKVPSGQVNVNEVPLEDDISRIYDELSRKAG